MKMHSSRSSVTEINIFNRKRRLTDKKVLGVFIICTIFWISIAIYAYISGDDSQIFSNDYRNSAKEVFQVSRIFVIIGYILLAGMYTVLIFIAMQWASHFSFFSLSTFWVAPVLTVFIAILKTNFATITLSIASFCSSILMYIIAYLEWFHLPDKILKKSCKLMIFSTAILFSAICCFLCILTTIVTIATHLYLNTIRQNDDSLPGYITFLMTINILLWSWLFLFTFNFWIMIFSGAITTWFLTEDKRKLSSDIFMQLLRFTIRHHLGTVAFSSSIFGSGKIHRMIIVHTIKRFKSGTANASFIFFALCNIFHPIVVHFTVSCSMIMCATNGSDFPESVKKPFDYFVKYPRKCLTVIKSIESNMICILTMLSLLLLISFCGYRNFLSPQTEEDNRQNIIFLAAIALGSVIFVGPLIMMLYAAYITVLVCLLEDSERNDGSKEKPYKISPELKTALIPCGPPEWCIKKLICCRCLTSAKTYTVANM